MRPMRTKLLVSAAVVAVAGSIGVAPAQAAVSGVCPPTLGLPGGNLTGTATDCNLFITFAATGGISTSAGPETNYDGSEDSLIGVINNTNHAITSFSLTGSFIFGFDNDGIDTYISGNPLAGNTDNTGYGGPLGFFTITDLNNGVVNFANGGIPAGETSYFSLEGPVNLDLVVGGGVPEPGTLALLGTGLFTLGFARRRKKTK